MYGSFKSNQLCSQSLLDTGHVCTDQCFDAGTKTIAMSKPGLVHLQPLSSPTSATPPSLQENLLFPFSDSTSHRSRTNSSRMELEESSKSWVTTSQTSTLPGFSETGIQYQDYAEDPGYSIVTTDHTADAIQLCDKWILTPYRYCLRTIGWLPFSQSRTGRVFHVIAVCLWTLAIIAAMITQIVSCFRRDVFVSVQEIPLTPPTQVNSTAPLLETTPPPFQCSNHIISSLILPDIVLLIAYFFGVFLFSKGETEYLFRLASHVFIKNAEAENRGYSKRLIFTIVLIFIGGLVWITFSLMIRVMAAIAGQLFDDKFVVFWPPGTYIFGGFKIFLVIFSLFGFFTFDLVYLFSVLNYAAQGEMNVYLLWDISRLIRNKKYDHIDGAIKATQESRQYLKVLNRNTATLTALALFVLGNLAVTALIDLEQVNEGATLGVSDPALRKLAAVAAGFNCVSWVVLVTVPFIQAARVTHACELLKDIGPEVRARPYQYQNTPQLDLDSLVSYLSSVDLRASIFGVPIYPWMGYTVIVMFSFVMFILFQLGIFNSLSPII